MSVAPPIEVLAAGDLPRSNGFGHSTAACSCGWTGRRRYLKAAAEQDAWVHSMHEKCEIAVPR